MEKLASGGWPAYSTAGEHRARQFSVAQWEDFLEEVGQSRRPEEEVKAEDISG